MSKNGAKIIRLSPFFLTIKINLPKPLPPFVREMPTAKGIFAQN
jgi:hypothetical protein